jgi:hypothetical protein
MGRCDQVAGVRLNCPDFGSDQVLGVVTAAIVAFCGNSDRDYPQQARRILCRSDDIGDLLP